MDEFESLDIYETKSFVVTIDERTSHLFPSNILLMVVKTKHYTT